MQKQHPHIKKTTLLGKLIDLDFLLLMMLGGLWYGANIALVVYFAMKVYVVVASSR
jgi:hypothetical protein